MQIFKIHIIKAAGGGAGQGWTLRDKFFCNSRALNGDLIAGATAAWSGSKDAIKRPVAGAVAATWAWVGGGASPLDVAKCHRIQ